MTHADACEATSPNRGKSEVENRLGRLVTGWLRRHRGLERGPKIISAGLRYATLWSPQTLSLAIKTP